jgi:predicted aconitase with swiveling domain
VVVILPIEGRFLVEGSAVGVVSASDDPISLWGGLDPATGEIIDRRHPLSGQIVAGRILSIPFGRGSCSASGVLLEAIHHGTAPAAIVVSRVDPILGLGAILGDELLDKQVPVVLVADEERRRLVTGMVVAIDAGGRITEKQTARSQMVPGC